MGGLGAQPPGSEITYIFTGSTLEMDKKLGIILKNKGLFRNLALLECFLGILGRPKKLGFFRNFRAT